MVCRAPRLGFGGLQWSLGSTSGLRGSQKCFGGPLVFSVGVSERLWGSPKGCRGLSVVFGGLQWSLGVSNGLWASLGVSSGLWGSPVIFDALQWSLELSNVLWGSPKSFAGPAVTFWGLQMIFGIQPPPPSPSPVCADNNHVRTWTVTRFRGMISTQPGSTPLASFKVLALEDLDGHAGCAAGTDIGRGAPGWGGGSHRDVGEGRGGFMGSECPPTPWCG